MYKTAIALLMAICISIVIPQFAICQDKVALVTPVVKRRIDSTLKSFIDAGKLAGVSALVYENGNEVYYNAFGYADREAATPMSRNTIVRIFSMTKPILTELGFDVKTINCDQLSKMGGSLHCLSYVF